MRLCNMRDREPYLLMLRSVIGFIFECFSRRIQCALLSTLNRTVKMGSAGVRQTIRFSTSKFLENFTRYKLWICGYKRPPSLLGPFFHKAAPGAMKAFCPSSEKSISRISQFLCDGTLRLNEHGRQFKWRSFSHFVREQLRKQPNNWITFALQN